MVATKPTTARAWNVPAVCEKTTLIHKTNFISFDKSIKKENIKLVFLQKRKQYEFYTITKS